MSETVEARVVFDDRCSPECCCDGEGTMPREASARLVDPEAVLVQLLEAERDERDRKRRWAGTVEDAAQFEREWLAFAQVISLLAPASPKEGQG